jgi:hypothetical protein
MSGEKRTFRLRKQNDPEVCGPMDAAELQELIDSAYISPKDEIATKGDNWLPVTEFPEFGMVWKIFAADGTLYGPTSLGTVREFVRSGEVRLDEQIIKVGEKDPRVIAEVLGEKETAALRAEIAGLQKTLTDGQMEQALETAREIRIRTLETELRNLQKNHDDLKHQYLAAREQLAKSR